MVKTLRNDNLSGRPAARAFLALSLAASLAAFGCTTNRTPGNGEPVTGAPGAGPGVPTSGVSSGSSTGSTAVNPPMMSSSTYIDALPTVNARPNRLPLSPDQAAAIMAGNQLDRSVRILGPSNPGGTGRSYASDVMHTGAWQNPAMQTAPIVTVNSSISSVAQVPALAGGGDTGGGVVGTDVSGAAVLSNATVTNDTAVFAPGTAAATPTTAAVPFTPGAFAAGPGSAAAATPGTAVANASTGTLTPTAASGAFPTATVASSPVIASTGTVRAAGTAAVNATNGRTVVNGATVSNANTAATTTTAASATNRTTTTAASTTTGTTGTRSATANVASPVRVTQDANGRVIVTNANATRSKSQ